MVDSSLQENGRRVNTSARDFSPRAALRPGDPFNPWRGACGFYPPDLVARMRELGDGPKRVYEHLVRRAGRDGVCFPGYDTIAADLGKGKRQIQNDVESLKAAGLIDWVSRQKRRSNTYRFLWHAVFERQDTATQEPPPDEFEVQQGATQAPGQPPLDGSECYSRVAGYDTLSSSGLPPNSVQEFSTGKSGERALEILVSDHLNAEINGKPADGALIRRIAGILGDPDTFAAYQAFTSAWLRTNRPYGWGIFVRLAEDAAASRKPADSRGTVRANAWERTGAGVARSADVA